MEGEITREDLKQELLTNWPTPVLGEVARRCGIPDEAVAGLDHPGLVGKVLDLIPLERLLEELLTREVAPPAATGPAEAPAAAPAAEVSGVPEVPPAAPAAPETPAPPRGDAPGEITRDALVAELNSNWTRTEVGELCSHFGVEVAEPGDQRAMVDRLLDQVSKDRLLAELVERENRRAASRAQEAAAEAAARDALRLADAAGTPAPGGDEAVPAAEPARPEEPTPASSEAAAGTGREREEEYDDSSLLKELRSIRRDSEAEEDAEKAEPEPGSRRSPVATLALVALVMLPVMWFTSPPFRSRVDGLLDQFLGKPGTGTGGTLVTTGSVDPHAVTTGSVPATMSASTVALVPEGTPGPTATPAVAGTGPAGPTPAPSPTPAASTSVGVPPVPTPVPTPAVATRVPEPSPVPTTPRPPVAPSVSPSAAPTPAVAPTPAPTVAAATPTAVPTGVPSPSAPAPGALVPADQLWSQAMAAEKAGDLAKAILRAEKARTSGGKDWAGYAVAGTWIARWSLAIGKDLFQQGDTAAAAAILRKSLELDASEAETHLALGRCLERSKAYPEALASYRRAVELKPDLGRAWSYLAYAYRAQKMYDEAERAAEEAAKHGEALDPGFLFLLKYRPAPVEP